MTTTAKSIPQLPEDADVGQKLAWLNDRYVSSFRDGEFLERLGQILVRGGDGRLLPEPARFGIDREARGLMVTGESGSSKTTLIRRNLCREFGVDPIGGKLPPEVLRIDLPPACTLKSFGVAIIEKTGYSVIKESRPSWEIWQAARHRLVQNGIRLVWVDEGQHVFRAGRIADVLEVCNTFKTLLKGDHAVALILSGIPELANFTDLDPQASRRFLKLHLDPVMESADAEAMSHYLATLCRHVGLATPRDDEFIPRLFHAVNYGFGSCFELTIMAARPALERGAKALSFNDYSKAFAMFTGRKSTFNPFDVEYFAETKAGFVRQTEELTVAAGADTAKRGI
ncbi:TniB family NTP-binding protein [Defluviimonas salinarum]|uniref:TniB family NTP-binding protein n=1 Tax=Defluviimonas salinarum TaxID=2992147 RepID=A0ABT3J7A8_9RHOB|nr:TniB family NTP-binding protein [Defluviimonas salinarum]MCW3783553.1 TniB family NTP-binding protein [Defluviimonas salinarum]